MIISRFSFYFHFIVIPRMRTNISEVASKEGDSTSDMDEETDDVNLPGPSTSSPDKSTNPFSKLEEDVTNEQWMKWKRMNQQVRYSD